MTFRYDINALRAVAVILVMLFHFGIGGFGGGFIGVDIFFVISGFLMTGIIIGGLNERKFSILRFYLARAKRIIPALMGLCIGVLIFGWFWMAPSEYAMTGKHSASSLGFFSNFVYKDEAGYFDNPSQHKWLLHTWSLSVEWQFYLLYPLILAGIARATNYSQRALHLTLIVLGLISLIGSFILSPMKPEFSFFILPTRMWQMIAGGLVYLYAPQFQKLPAQTRHYLSYFGLGMMLLSGMLFHSDYPWPGFGALLPIGGAVLFLLATQQNLLWVKNPLIQRLGDWSYSIYLWHWPIYVGFSYFSFQFPGWQAAGIALSVFAGYLSYILIEQPVRKASFKKTQIALLLGSLTLIAGYSFLIQKQDGFGFRVDQSILIADNEANNIPPKPLGNQCLPNPDRPGREICIYGDANNPRVIVWGDSHAGTMMTAVHTAIGGGVVSFFNQCPIILNARMKGKTRKKNCPEFQLDALHSIKTMPADIPLIVVSRFAAQIHGPNETQAIVYGLIYDDLSPEEKKLSSVQIYQQRLVKTLCEVSAYRQVYVVEPIPEMGTHIPRLIVRQLMTGQEPKAGLPYSEYVERNQDVMPTLQKAAEECGVKLLKTSDYLCPDKKTCLAIDPNGRPLYYDDDHISEYGNRLLVPMFEKITQ